MAKPQGGNQKFRPYFTSPELSEIISCLKENPSQARLSISRYLESYLLKINHGVISPSHTLEPTLEQKLGFAQISEPIHAIDKAAYEKHVSNPSSCTPQEIAEALDYKYRSNLMTPEEEKEYEQRNIS